MEAPFCIVPTPDRNLIKQQSPSEERGLLGLEGSVL